MTNFDNEIAIVGLSIRFPGANTYRDFWEALEHGRDCGKSLSREQLLQLGVEADKLNNPNYVYRSYGLDNIDLFDADFFGFSPREARLADPQLRLLLETAYEAMEDSGHNLFGSNAGVYLGAADHKYWLYHNLYHSCFEEEQEIAKRILGAKDYFATQISHKLNLTGPSISLTSACSSALLAVHEACNHLLMYDCDYAMAGGCEVVQDFGYLYQEGGLTSQDGYVRAFDKNASGTVFGSGVGLVVLRRVEDAIADRDHIYAIIKSTAVNNDGNQKVGYIAPGIPGQMGVICEAIKRAGVNAREIDYIETHGTGTPVGDPIEIESLNRVFRQDTNDRQFCAIGSVKTNVGHLSAAAGIVGLIKTALMLHHRRIPPSLNFSEANPAINFSESPFFVNTKLKDWDSDTRPRIAGVSAFGVGGTNVHAILGEKPGFRQNFTEAERGRSYISVLSAKTENALKDAKERLAAYLKDNPELNIADVSYTLNEGRQHYEHRTFFTAGDIAQALLELGSDECRKDSLKAIKNPQFIFMFPGQGSQYIDMSKDIYQSNGYFRDMVDHCSRILELRLGIQIKYVLFPNSDEKNHAEEKIAQTEFAQVCLFVVSYSLARLYMHLGVMPAALVGHSVGEYVAACLSGVFSLEDALVLVAKRGRYMQDMADGAMLSIEGSALDLASHLSRDTSIAAINSPSLTVVAGSVDAIRNLRAQLAKHGFGCSLLATSRAFHSVAMEPMLADYMNAVAEIQLNRPEIPFISNVTGMHIRDEEATSPKYWADHVRRPVLFSAGIQSLLAQSVPFVFLEIGPGATLSTLVAHHEVAAGSRIFRSMRRANENNNDFDLLLDALGKVWCAGAQISWANLLGKNYGSRLSLPTYPFQRERYWLENERPPRNGHSVDDHTPTEHPLLGRRIVSSSHAIVYENLINKSTPAFIADHCLMGITIFPGAAYTQIALAIGRIFLNDDRIKISEISFAQALMLPDGTNRVLQIVLTTAGLAGNKFEILSRPAGATPDSMDKSPWVLHAEGCLSIHAEAGRCIDIATLKLDINVESKSIEQYYNSLRFITYGPSFRAVKQLSKDDQGVRSIGRIELPERLKVDEGTYSFHPVLLDACFQVMDGLETSAGEGTLPIGLKNMVVYAPIPDDFYVITKRKTSAEQISSIGEMTIVSECGVELAYIEHYMQKDISEAGVIGSRVSDILYELTWREQSSRSVKPAALAEDNWLILSDDVENFTASCISRFFERYSQSAVCISAKIVGDESWRGDFIESEVFEQLSESKLAGILYIRGINGSFDGETLCVEVLSLVKSIVAMELEHPPALFLVTKGAQFVGEEDRAQRTDGRGLHQATLWGMGNTICIEHPELRCVRIDMDPYAEVEESAAYLVHDILYVTDENQIAYRRGRRFVPRLSSFNPSKANLGGIEIPQGPYEMRLERSGTFDGFHARNISPVSVGPHQVHVRIKAAALNFKETLYVLGLLNKSGRPGESISFGLEGAGVVSQVGSQVTHLKVGDSVIVSHVGCLKSDIVVAADKVVLKPHGIDFFQASCIPIVYLTAYYALHSLAKIKEGDRVLIHACAGGVGLAALQIALAVGADVFATASKGKWDFLRSQGVKHVCDSRSFDFVDYVYSATHGEGINIVLNSLRGEFITKSFDVLAHNGAFVEIGKRDIWTSKDAIAYRPDVSYYPFELGEGEVTGEIGGDSVVAELMSKVLEDFKAGRLKPLPLKIFSPQDLSFAYRYLSAGKNIGKVVIDFHMPDKQRTMTDLIKKDRSYLITGGLGGLGMLTAKWLARKGAQHIVLMSRNEPTNDMQAILEQISDLGVNLVVVRGDVASRPDLARIIDEMESSVAPMGGVLHCAGVLEDATLSRQTAATFGKCFSPKVSGSWNLHILTKDKDIDLFVCFSSVSSIFDGGGQSNYAAANAFMDHLVPYRRSLGLPGLVVNWGGWEGVGMAAKLALHKGDKTTNLLNPEEAFLALENVLLENYTQAVVCRMGERLTSPQVPKLLTDLVKTCDPANKKETQLERIIRENPKNTFAENIRIFVRNQVMNVLGTNPDKIEMNSEMDFIDLGVDSLAMTELKNTVQAGLGITLKMGVFFAHSSISKLSDYLVNEMKDRMNDSTSVVNGLGGVLSAESADGRVTLVNIAKSSSETSDNVFCIPGLNNNVYDFSDFAHQNKEKYNIRVTQFDEKYLTTDIQSTAQHVKNSIIEVQKKGPFSLIGYSYGGLVALEVANQLVEAGEAVKFLIMVDSLSPFQYLEHQDFKTYLMALTADSLLMPFLLEPSEYNLYVSAMLNSLGDKVPVDFDKLPSIPIESRNSYFRMFNQIVEGWDQIFSNPYKPRLKNPNFPIYFIRSRFQPMSVKLAGLDKFLGAEKFLDDCYGWGELLSTKLNTTVISSDHSRILRKQHISEITEVFEAACSHSQLDCIDA